MYNLCLQILPASLEKVPEYQDFTDFCHTLQLTRGKNDDDEDENVIGEFKVRTGTIGKV